MNNIERMRYMISSFSGQDRTLTVPKVYVEYLKDINAAMLLNQIVFWSDKSKRNDGYFYKTYAEWEDEITLTEYQVRRATKKLKDLGLVDTKLKRANGSPTLHYKIDIDKLSISISEFINNGNLTNLRNETKVTKETLTEEYTLDYNNTNNVQNESATDSLQERFDKLWKLYPIKKGKALAFKSYKRDIKKKDVTDSSIEKGILKYISNCKKENTDKRYMKHGGTFFSQQVYLDDYEADGSMQEVESSNKPKAVVIPADWIN